MELLSDKLQSMSESATIKMAQQARELKAQGHDVISLSLGEPDFDTPDHIKEAAKKALDEGYTKYTPVPGLIELREAISTKFKRDNNLDYATSQIVVSNGAKQSIANICLSVLNPGDEVILFTPYWVSYFEIVKFAGGKPLALAAPIEQDFKVSSIELEAALTDKTKIVIFSSPCNPTGSVYTKVELENLAEVFAKYPNLIVVSDEIYEHINFTNQHFSIGSIPSMKDRTVTVNGMSKGFAMTGWRLGYIGAPQWLANACAKVQGQFTSGATAFGQKAAADALMADMRPTLEMKAAFKKRRDLVISLLEEIPFLEVNAPRGAFYIFPNIQKLFGKQFSQQTISNANDFAEMLLKEEHVAIVSGTAFGNDNCFRLSYAASEDQLREAIRRIANFVSKLT